MQRSVKLGWTAAVSGSMLPLAMNCSRSPAVSDVTVSVVTGEDTFKNTIKAVDMIGGMTRFVPDGSKVAILPNSQGRHPGTFTNPDVVRAIIRMCKEAGAAEVNCLSWLPNRNWESSGLGEAVTSEGANLKLVEREDANFKSVPLPNGKLLKEAKIMNELFANDTFIDIPITKDHAGNKFTGTMKNLMGLNHPASNRFFHTGSDENPDSIEHLDQCIADLNLAVAPTLCIVDATEFITTNGPFGPGELDQSQEDCGRYGQGGHRCLLCDSPRLGGTGCHHDRTRIPTWIGRNRPDQS